MISGNFRFDKGRVYLDLYRDDIVDHDRVTIKVTDEEGDHLHTKFLPPLFEHLTVDLTPYVKAYINEDFRDFLQSGGEANWFNLSVFVYVEEVRNSYLCDGFNFDNLGILTKLPYLQISKGADGSVDPLWLVIRLPDDADMEICTSEGCSQLRTEGNYDLQVHTIQADTPNVEISDLSGNYGDGDLLNPFMKVKTVPRGINTRRIVWRNELGGVDSWNFEFLRESTFVTSSDVFYSSTKGYTRTKRQYERVNIVETREVDDKTANVLAYITASPYVCLWDAETAEFTPIDIVTEECRTYSDTELTSIQIAYRLKERERL